jgi:hypothetical protein
MTLSLSQSVSPFYLGEPGFGGGTTFALFSPDCFPVVLGNPDFFGSTTG